MTGAVAIVTGAASGIGAGIASHLAGQGMAVCAVDRDPAPPPPGGVSLTEDLADPAAPDRIAASVLDRFGRIDLLVNNAGIGGSRAVHETDDAGWERVMGVNLTAAFRMSRAVLPAMLTAEAGCIIHVASMFGLVGYRNSAAYAASKAGLGGLTRQMTADYAPRGIRVNAVAPGLIRTAMTDRLVADPTYAELVLRGTPIGRPGKVEEVAALVGFLASDAAAFICGQVIAIDGGWTAARVRTEEG